MRWLWKPATGMQGPHPRPFSRLREKGGFWGRPSPARRRTELLLAGAFGVYGLADSIETVVGADCQFFVRDAHDLYSHLLEASLPSAVGRLTLGGLMNVSAQFDGEAQLRGVEIEH